jgi:prefoldin subunit 5
MDTAINPGAGEQGGAATPTQTPAQTPTPVKVSDDLLLQVEGSDKPVTYKEHFRGLQSELTKRAQAAKRYEEQHRQLEARLQERENQLRQYVEAVQRIQAQRQGGGQDPYGDLENSPYVNGRQAADAFRALNQQYGQIPQALQQRDQAILLLGTVIQNLQAQVQQFAQQRGDADLEAKIRKFVKDGNYPDEAYDLAREIYGAYEGDDLDQDFPDIFKKRWDQVVALARKLDQDKLRSQRTLPWTPGKGGQGSASKPFKIQDHSARGIADQLWPSISGGSET